MLKRRTVKVTRTFGAVVHFYIPKKKNPWNCNAVFIMFCNFWVPS